jgi:D-sedoheptulose 7-phosphate isomerase
MLLAFGSDAEAVAALQAAARRGCLTIAFEAIGAEWELEPAVSDPLVCQELVETAYHMLWELVHVFFEHRGIRGPGETGGPRGGGAAGFLYPFLAERERTPESLGEEVRSSIRLKAHEIGALRAQILTDGRETLVAAARAMRECFQGGGTLLALGNGGSATDAMDAVADLCHPLRGRRARPAIDLTEDPAILTAITNDVGVEAVFAREVIAYGREGDVLLAFSTSGSSANVIEALVRARACGLTTIAMVGYDGGRIASESLADHLLVARSEHIPRIQEAHASAWHVLRELLEEPA